MSFELLVDIQQQQPFPLNVQLQCQPGELLVLLGPSGCGKSTLLRMIAGLQHPAHGQIHFGQQAWFQAGRALKPQQRRIGYVPQHYGLFPHMSAQQNIAAALHALPDAERQTQAKQWLKRMQLEPYARQKPAELSGGQQQRVALARALAAQPSVLLLDEPFSALGQLTRADLYMLLAELKRELRIPIILVTHNLEEARLLADKMAVMHQGKILQVGSPASVMQQPNQRQVALTVGMQNIFKSTVVSGAAAGTKLRLGVQVLDCAFNTSAEEIEWCLPATAVTILNEDVLNNTSVSAPTRASTSYLSGQITRMARLGEDWQLAVRLTGLDALVHVRQRNAEYLQLGQSVNLAFDMNRAHIFEGAGLEKAA